MPIPALISAGAALAPYALAPFQHGGKDIDWNQIEQWLATLRPEGYVSDADLAAAEGTRARGTRHATETAGNLRAEAMRRWQQRGGGTAGAAETTLGRIGQIEARGRQAAGDTAEEQIYNIRKGNQRFEQQKAMTLIGAKLRDVVGKRSRQDSQLSTFYNSLMEYTPSALDAIDRSGLTKNASRRSFNPATGGFDRLGPIDSALGDDADYYGTDVNEG